MTDDDITERLDELEAKVDDISTDTIEYLLEAAHAPDDVIERYDSGLSAEVQVTRGTGTRDQEKWTLKGKGRTANAAMGDLVDSLEDVVGDLDPDDPLADQVREFQPGDDGDD